MTSDTADLIAEAILREMARATRFSTCEDAWKALLNVRRIADSITQECKPHHQGGEPSTSKP